MIKLTKHTYYLLILTLFFVSCEGDEDVTNLLDPGGGDYDPPETTIVSGPDNITLTTDDLTYTFTGNELVTEFSYRLDVGTMIGNWSDWSTEASVTFTNLDEGSHTFNVKGRYSDVDEDGSPATATFTVDAVTGPSILFYPRSPSVPINSVFSVDIVAEEVDGVSGIEIEIEYEDDYLTLQGDLIQGSVLTDEIVVEEVSSESIRVTIGITAGADGENLIGTETLFSLQFTSIQTGTSEISFNTVQYRDENNNIIEIHQTINSIVTVQ